MGKKILFVISGIVLIPVVLYFSFWFFLAGSFIMHDFSLKNSLPDPASPEITYAEFPFKIELEHNGEQIIFVDTVICEYAGVRYIKGAGKKVREWRNRLKSEEKFTDKKKVETILKLELKNHLGNYMSIDYCYGSADYYMGDIGENREFSPRTEIMIYPDFRREFKSDNELLDYYGIKIISIEETPPIKNTFK